MGSDLEDLKWGLKQVAEGKIKPTLDRTLPLSQAEEAHRLNPRKHQAGPLLRRSCTVCALHDLLGKLLAGF